MNVAPKLNRKLKVLVIDDDKKFLADITRDLGQTHEFEVLTEVDGFKAVELAKEHDVDIVILDMQNDGTLDGSEIHRAFREDPALKTIPQAYITNKWAGAGDLNCEDSRRGRVGGMRFIVKGEPLHHQLARIAYVIRRWNADTGDCD